ncbi:hypothetical protein [Weissella confusa]
MAVGLVENYKENTERFIGIWFISLLSVLAGLAVYYAPEVNLNLQTLFEGMVGDVRLSRVSVGFPNVNNLGGLAATLIMISVLNLVSNRKNFVISSYLAILLGSILLINSGSRTATLSVIVALLCIPLVWVKRKLRVNLWICIVGIQLLISGFITSLLYISDRNSYLFKKLDDVLSYRLYFGNASLEWLRNHSSGEYFFGAGLKNVPVIAHKVFIGQGAPAIDMSIAFFGVSFGVVGLVVVYLFWQYGLVKIGLNGDMTAILTGVYISTFMVSEAVLFGINGLFGAFWTVLFLMLLRKSSDTQQVKIEIHHRRGKH